MLSHLVHDSDKQISSTILIIHWREFNKLDCIEVCLLQQYNT